MSEIYSRDKFPARPAPGLVVRYPYLWHDEVKSGKIVGGLKNRACAVILSYESIKQLPGKVIVDVAAITHSSGNEAVEIPLAVKKRMGLDNDHSWIITTEVNRFIWPGDLTRARQAWQPGGGMWHWGFLPNDIFRKARDLVTRHRDEKTLNVVPRPGG